MNCFALFSVSIVWYANTRWCIQKFPDCSPDARTANGTALCQEMQFYHCFVSQYSEFCRHNPFCCFSTSLLLLFTLLSTQSGNFWIHVYTKVLFVSGYIGTAVCVWVPTAFLRPQVVPTGSNCVAFWRIIFLNVP
jgi:hypothetical protein